MAGQGSSDQDQWLFPPDECVHLSREQFHSSKGHSHRVVDIQHNKYARAN